MLSSSSTKRLSGHNISSLSSLLKIVNTWRMKMVTEYSRGNPINEGAQELRRRERDSNQNFVFLSRKIHSQMRTNYQKTRRYRSKQKIISISLWIWKKRHLVVEQLPYPLNPSITAYICQQPTDWPSSQSVILMSQGDQGISIHLCFNLLECNGNSKIERRHSNVNSKSLSNPSTSHH